MSSSKIARSGATIGVAGLCGVSVFGATPAIAAPDDCSTVPGATEIVSGICQVVITADGVYTFPTTIDKLSAVVVGAGGGSYESDFIGAYGGGGGEVVYVDNVALGTPITVDVGTGGAAGAEATIAADGTDTVFGSTTARGGIAPYPSDPTDPANSSVSSGDSGNGNSGQFSGAGAAGDASGTIPGPGYLLSAVPGVDATLFPSAANGAVEYGKGGTAGETQTPAVPSSGTGGSAFYDYSTTPETFGSQAGDDGVVILRYALAGTLASTGVEANVPLIAGTAATVAGAALLAGSSVTRRHRKAS